ncbi:MAG: CDP-alcohol phosphatidyltransferase family protein [Pseudomonadota bacterium]
MAVEEIVTDPSSRRPLASRGTFWAKAMASRLARRTITPNQISQAGIGFALIAGVFFWLSADLSGWARILCLIGAAVGIQLRLLCNLLDGMVAVEAGKGAPDGAFWNEVPDRIADILILVGAGYGAGLPALGWAASAFAVFTAYLRAFGQSLGQAADFRGPMAKPHRMAALTFGALATCFEPLLGDHRYVLATVLTLVLAGTLWTCLRRARGILAFLNRKR